MFGVPGDYSLALLDHVTHHPVMRWTGCTNELGARSASVGAATFAPVELPTALAALEPLVAVLDRSAPPVARPSRRYRPPRTTRP